MGARSVRVFVAGALCVVAVVLVGCGDPGKAVSPTGGQTTATQAVPDAAGNGAELRDIELSKADLKEELGDPEASTKYPGLDALRPQAGPVDEWVDIAAAGLKKPSTEGTLLLTETALYFADLSGKLTMTFICGNIESVSSEDLTLSVTVSGEDVAFDVALLHVASSANDATFVVERNAAAELKARILILKKWAVGA